MTDPDIPANAGRYRPIQVIAPAGTVVNAKFPHATVGGNSEVHPHLVTLIWKAMAEAVPDKVGASGSETAMLVTYGGTDKRTGEMFSNLIIEGQGWGGKLGRRRLGRHHRAELQLRRDPDRSLRDALSAAPPWVLVQRELGRRRPLPRRTGQHPPAASCARR